MKGVQAAHTVWGGRSNCSPVVGMIDSVKGDPFLLDFVVSDQVLPPRQTDVHLPHKMASCGKNEHVHVHIVGVYHSFVTVVRLSQHQGHIHQVLPTLICQCQIILSLSKFNHNTNPIKVFWSIQWPTSRIWPLAGLKRRLKIYKEWHLFPRERIAIIK